jgi:hypothetical protein
MKTIPINGTPTSADMAQPIFPPSVVLGCVDKLVDG